MFQELPHEFVSPKDLKEITERGGKLGKVMRCLS